ncbi:MAG: hypothetical protein NVS1B4_03680 [Gemmatimonadaceae bacterium]
MSGDVYFCRLYSATVPHRMAAMLGDILFWLSVASCAIAQGAILYSLFSARSVIGVEGVRRGRPATELLWAVLPPLALAFILVLTYRAMHSSRRGQPAPPAPAPVTTTVAAA